MSDVLKLKVKTDADTTQIDDSAASFTQDVQALARSELSIEDLLVFATEHNCSDLYIKTFEQPYVSRFGKITMLPCMVITKTAWANFYDKYILNELHAGYVREKLLDTSVGIRVPDNSPNFGHIQEYRYRVSFGFSEEKNIATFRMISPKQPTFDTINYNPQCVEALRKAYAKPSGICYETGPTGSGKSTTMAACLNTFTQKDDILDNKVIITLEDPIENKFSSTESVKINQKELGKDFKSFALGIKAALREHPNIIVVGECRDKEVICAAIEAARTGHITSTTFHSADVAGTVSRLLYHLDNDKNLSLDLICQLNIILSQKMIKNDDGYLVDTQYLLFDDYVIEKLSNALDNPNANITAEIEQMIHDPDLQKQGISKDWDYKELH